MFVCRLGMMRRNRMTFMQELEIQMFVERSRLLLVGSGQRRSRSWFHAEMIEPFLLGFEVVGNVTQVLPASQLADRHCHELTPAAV